MIVLKLMKKLLFKMQLSAKTATEVAMLLGSIWIFTDIHTNMNLIAQYVMVLEKLNLKEPRRQESRLQMKMPL